MLQLARGPFSSGPPARTNQRLAGGQGELPAAASAATRRVDGSVCSLAVPALSRERGKKKGKHGRTDQAAVSNKLFLEVLDRHAPGWGGQWTGGEIDGPSD
jgi:hypothetical protein